MIGMEGRNNWDRHTHTHTGTSESLPGCQASCGLFVTMQCDSIGDIVLGAMSLMMNSSATITTLSLPRKYTHTHTRTLMCTKNITASQPTHTHTYAQTTQPPAPAALGDLHLVLESAGAWGWPGPACPQQTVGECSCSMWRVWLAELFCSAHSIEIDAPQLIKVHTDFCTIVPHHMNTHVQIVSTHTHHASNSGADLYISYIWSGFMASWPLAHPAAWSIS